jgi:hypothetical protein
MNLRKNSFKNTSQWRAKVLCVRATAVGPSIWSQIGVGYGWRH